MAKQNQATETKTNKSHKPKVEPAVVSDLTAEQAGLAQLPAGPLSAAGDGSIDAQAARLNDPRMLTVQRQAMAGQIGRVQGNQHFQRLISLVHQNGRVAPSSNGHGTTVARKSVNGSRSTSANKTEALDPALTEDGLSGSGAPTFAPATPPNGNGHELLGSGLVQREIESDEKTAPAAEEGICPVCGRRGKGRCFGCGYEFIPEQQFEAETGLSPDSVSNGAIQLKPSDYQVSADGGGVQQRMDRRIAEAEEEGDGEDVSPDEAARNIDRGELKQQQREIGSEAKPDVDRPAEEKSQVEQAAQKTQQEAEKPPEPQGQGEEKKPSGEEKGGDQAAGAAEQAAGLAEQAFSTAEAQPQPETPPEVTPPEPVAEPVDAAGEPLPGDPGADAAVMDLAQQAQSLRQGGYQLQAQAAEARANAATLRGNLQLVNKGISQAELGIQKSTDHLQFRKDAVGQAEEALTVSEEKAAMVAKEAPGVSEKAAEGKEDSGPMAQEAQETAAENAAKTPDDPEAAGKSREQGQRMNKVGSDTATMDDAISQTKDKAGTLAEDAARATEMNTETRGKIDGMNKTLGQTEGRLAEMQGQNAQARGRLEGLLGAPDQMIAQANELEQKGQTLIDKSVEMEGQLHQVQEEYQAGMQSVPIVEPTEPNEESSEAEGAVQLSPEEGRYEDRINVNLAGGLPDWFTGAETNPEDEARRQQAINEQNQRRNQRIANLTATYGENFENMSVGQRMSAAMGMTFENLFSSASQIQWPGFGTLALGLIDPRGPLMGVLSGLGMMISGAANLFSAEQWARDPLGNLLKSAADIATGLTVVLGSITALAGVVIAIMAAITLISVGTAAPVTGPIIAFCTSVLTTVGGWTIAVGKVALILQALVFVKNLRDAATAETAEDLVNQSDQMSQDISNAGNVVMQMGMAKLAQVGGRAQQSQIAQAGGGVRYAAALPGRTARTVRAIPGQVGKGLRAAGRGIKRAAGRVVSGTRSLRTIRTVRAIPGQVGKGLRAAGRGIKRAAGRVVSGTRSLRTMGVRGALGRGWQGMRNIPRNMRNQLRREFRRSLIVGDDDIDSFGDAVRVAGETRRAVREVSQLGPMNPETQAMLERNHTLREALIENPRAARALKLCDSPCFPPNANPSQIQRIESLIEKRGFNPDALREFLHNNSSNLNRAIDILESVSPRQARRLINVLDENGIPVTDDLVDILQAVDDVDAAITRIETSWDTNEASAFRGSPSSERGIETRGIPDRMPTTEIRQQPGFATGGKNLPDLPTSWLQGQGGQRIVPIPGRIASQLRGMRFRNWRHFRETFWELISRDSELAARFSSSNQTLIGRGRAPFTIGDEAVGGGANARYQLDHVRSLEEGGGLYDLDNIMIVTPRTHGNVPNVIDYSGV